MTARLSRRRHHLRHRLPQLRGRAAGPRLRLRTLSSTPAAQPSSGWGAAGGRRSSRGAVVIIGFPAGVPSRSPSAALVGDIVELLQLRQLPLGHRRAVRALLRRAGAGAGQQRQAPPRAAALLQPPAAQARLRAAKLRPRWTAVLLVLTPLPILAPARRARLGCRRTSGRRSATRSERCPGIVGTPLRASRWSASASRSRSPRVATAGVRRRRRSWRVPDRRRGQRDGRGGGRRRAAEPRCRSASPLACSASGDRGDVLRGGSVAGVAGRRLYDVPLSCFGSLPEDRAWPQTLGRARAPLPAGTRGARRGAAQRVALVRQRGGRQRRDASTLAPASPACWGPTAPARARCCT